MIKKKIGQNKKKFHTLSIINEFMIRLFKFLPMICHWSEFKNSRFWLLFYYMLIKRCVAKSRYYLSLWDF
jgi:hypothetical protein